jgi:hypothetical protein
MDLTSGVYRPVTAYQTRIIRLHAAKGSTQTPLVYTLIVADILHPSFEGLGTAAFTSQNVLNTFTFAAFQESR